MGVDTHLYHAINFHGSDQFVVSLFREDLRKQEADREEKLLIKVLHLNDPDFGYNMTDGGEGTIPNEEARRKMIENSGVRRRDVEAEEVVSLYRTGLSMTQIGKRMGASRKVIQRRLLELEEPIRPLSETQVLRYDLKMKTEDVVQMYRVGKSISQIAEYFGVHSSTIRKRLQKAKEPIRSCSEGKTLRHGKGLDNSTIQKLYADGFSVGEIAEKFGVWDTTIYRRLETVGKQIVV